MTAFDPESHSPTESPKPTDSVEPDIVEEARKIGLQPTVAYVPVITPETPQERQKRQKREHARKKRADALAMGLQQLNIPEVPSELVDEVKAAVAAVLSGQTPGAGVQTPPPRQNSGKGRFLGVAVALATILSFLIGWMARSL